MIKNYQKGFSTLTAVLVVALLLMTGTATYFIGRYTQMTSSNSGEGAPIDKTPDIPEKPLDKDKTTNTGFIEGSISFPSEFLPDQTVCAQNLDTDVEICGNANVVDDKYTYGKGYKLEVPAGTYHVYVRWQYEGEEEESKIYYNEFVTCGLNYNCPSHEPIPVTVIAGETVSGIDPQDWYNFNSN